jgi:uncharacterized membrane protein YczE
MELLKKDLKRLPILLLGFAFLSFGIVLTMRADLGMNAWGVFHQGLSVQTGLTFGLITILLGLVILGFSIWLLKTKIGIGTVLNVLVVGVMIDISDYLFTFIPETTIEKTVLLVIGLFVMTFGRALYISTGLGEGPRDGLFVGLHLLTKYEIKYIKPAIEFTVLLFGFLLGGTVGLGTLVIIVASGYLVQTYFKVLHYDPKTSKQRRFADYYEQRKKGTI